MLDSSRSEAVVVALAATSGVIKSAAQVPFSPSARAGVITLPLWVHAIRFFP